MLSIALLVKEKEYSWTKHLVSDREYFLSEGQRKSHHQGCTRGGGVKGIQVPWWSEENIFEGLKDHFLQRTILDTDCMDMVLHLSVFLSVASICYILRNP